MKWSNLLCLLVAMIWSVEIRMRENQYSQQQRLGERFHILQYLDLMMLNLYKAKQRRNTLQQSGMSRLRALSSFQSIPSSALWPHRVVFSVRCALPVGVAALFLSLMINGTACGGCEHITLVWVGHQSRPMRLTETQTFSYVSASWIPLHVEPQTFLHSSHFWSPLILSETPPFTFHRC